MIDLKEEIRQDLWNVINKHYLAEDYTEALRDAAFLLKDILQNKSGEFDKDNSKLVEAVLNGTSPVLKVNNFTTQTEKDFQSGISLGIKGIFMHVRNPISHEKIVYEKADADAILMYIDYLLRQIDKSNGVSLIEEWLPLVADATFTDTEEYAKELIKEVPKKKVYELLLAIYNHRCDLPRYRLKFFIRELVGKLTNEEKNNFVNMVNIDLAKTSGDYGLSMFFHFFGEHFYSSLKKVVKLRIEDLVYQGITNGKIVGGKAEGCYAPMATWAINHINRFETQDKCIICILNKAISNKAESDYVSQYFLSYIDLHDEKIMVLMDKTIKKPNVWNVNIYSFVRKFILDKTDNIYQHYKDEIDEYENQYVKEEDRIPEKIDTDFPF